MRSDRKLECTGTRAGSAGAGVLLLTLALLAAAGPSKAQMVTPAPPQDGPIALTGGTIHTVANGVVENGTILFEDGVITAVGTEVDVPAGAERIDVSGRHVYPGLIDAFSQMGLYEIGQVGVTVDVNELGAFNPNVRAEVAFNPESRHIGTTRSNGVLVTVSTPNGGLVSGLSATMMLDGWTWEQMVVKAPTALNVQWPFPGDLEAYEAQIDTLREAFARARAYRDAQAAPNVRHPTDSRLEAMIPALELEIPVVVTAQDVQQIEDALAWGRDEGIRLVLRGGMDAHYVADQLAEHDVPVLLTSVMSAPARDWEGYDGAYGLPARLHEAGVRFAITGGSSAPYGNRLPYEAGVAVAFGLPEEEALRAVTLYPARFLGVEDRLGSLEPGKDATLIVTTGFPLEYEHTVERAFIQGRDIDLMDAHRQFFEKYMEKVRQAPLWAENDR